MLRIALITELERGVDMREEEILLVPTTIKLETKAPCCAMQKQHLCSNPGRREGGEGNDCWGFTRAWKEARVWSKEFGLSLGTTMLLFLTHLAFVPP